jgi:hypothetical protein
LLAHVTTALPVPVRIPFFHDVMILLRDEVILGLLKMASFIVPGFLCQKTDKEEHKELLFCSETHVPVGSSLRYLYKYRYYELQFDLERVTSVWITRRANYFLVSPTNSALYYFT